jgi:acetylornithine/N-succinyldiaminopimelate aminotransferase
MENADKVGTYLTEKLRELDGISQVRGRGLMIGMDFPDEVKELRKSLLFDQKVFTGVSGSHTIRLLPPLCLSLEQAELFIGRLRNALQG